jgi:hypothetical protein
MANMDVDQLMRTAAFQHVRKLGEVHNEWAALESSQLRHGVLTYALLHEGLGEGKADRNSKDGRITEAKWLKYGVQRVPSLYGELISNTFIGKGFKRRDVSAGGATPAQRPALFDFRRSERPEPLLAGSIDKHPL